MADEPQYPLTALHFQVEWGGDGASFSEVSGLTLESEPIEYRGGDDRTLTVRKVPGLRKYGNVTLKRGIMAAQNGFWKWWESIVNGQVSRRVVTVTLLNETGDHVMTWKIQQAWPVKLEAPAFSAKGNEIAIETMEFAHEGVVIEAA